MSQLRSKKLLLLVAIILLAFGVRLFRITNQPADWHAFRQADTASVTREYVKHGIDLSRPRYHDLSNIQSGQDNLAGYRMVEFPIINANVALVLSAIPGLSLVPVSRLASVLFSIGTLVSLFWLVDHLSNRRTAYLTAIVFAFMPYAIYYSRVIMPEPGMLFFSTFSLLAFCYWIKKNSWRWLLASAVSLSLAFLLKPFVVFTAPVYLAILVLKRKRWYLSWELIVFGLIAVLPILWWRTWIQQFPTGIPASDWLYNGNLIRWRPAWFRWLFFERLTKLMLGWAGVVLLPLNLFNRNQDFWIYGAWWLGMLAYLSVFATGNVQHDYYQILLIPIVAISVGRGAVVAYDWLLGQQVHPRASIGLVCLVLLLSFSGAWYYIRGYFNINHWEYIRAGQAADQLLPLDAKVIAPAFGDTIFLFQTNRTGWPIGFEIDDKISKGATHYVNSSYDDETNQLKSDYSIIKETDEYIIIDLTKPKIQ
jgi:hypothetical protein